jgi:hypothetical protein
MGDDFPEFACAPLDKKKRPSAPGGNGIFKHPERNRRGTDANDRGKLKRIAKRRARKGYA